MVTVVHWWQPVGEQSSTRPQAVLQTFPSIEAWADSERERLPRRFKLLVWGETLGDVRSLSSRLLSIIRRGARTLHKQVVLGATTDAWDDFARHQEDRADLELHVDVNVSIPKGVVIRAPIAVRDRDRTHDGSFADRG